MRIAFLPLDERPVTRDAFLRLAAIAGADVATPAREQLGSLKRPADVEAMWAWLEGPGADADLVIASAELLIYGGLVPSRVGREPLDRCLALAARWRDARRAAPRRRVYLSASNLRLPNSADGTEEPDYWTEFGPQIFACSFHEDRYEATGDPASRDRAAAAAAGVPETVLADVRWRRARNLAVLRRLVELAGAEVFDGLLIGQDDAAEYGWTRRDLRAVTAAVEEHRAASRAWVTYGTDELTARLLARAVVTGRDARPAVRVTYSAPAHRDAIPRYEGQALDLTVTSHIVTAGCRRAEAAPPSPDLSLFVHNSPGDQLEAPDQQPYPPAELDSFFEALADATASGTPCAVADVRYSNGADRTLVARLLGAPRASGVAAYGGWNTMSNALGMALAQAVVSARPVAHPAVDGAGRTVGEHANRDFTILRLLDDWGYQANVRQRLAREVLPRYPGARSSDIGPAYAACAEAARRWLQETCAPHVAASFGVPIAVGPVGFPWNRLFHVALDIQVGTSRSTP
ncbi:MAG TPA: DUF4127 family protein [bacterium]|nr:DUF4127 family protein [bacterium]